MTLRLYPYFPKAGFGDVRRLAGLRIHLYIPHPSTLLIYFFHIYWIYLDIFNDEDSDRVANYYRYKSRKSRDTKKKLSVLQISIKLLSNKSDHQTLP